MVNLLISDNHLHYAFTNQSLVSSTHSTLPGDNNGHSPDSSSSSRHNPVLLGVPPQPQSVVQNSSRLPQQHVIRRDNRTVAALSLPNIMVTNHRSVFPKFNNLVDEQSEIWENKHKAAHANKVEDLNFKVSSTYFHQDKINEEVVLQ